jgi:hypothetical protein
MRSEARFCDQCGHSLSEPGTARKVRSNYPPSEPQLPSAPVTSRASPMIAAILALGPGLFGLMGLGHIYVRALAKGLVLLIIGAVLGLFTWVLIIDLFLLSPLDMGPNGAGLIGAVSLFSLIFFPLWLWQAYDAYIIAKTMQPSPDTTIPPPYY